MTIKKENEELNIPIGEEITDPENPHFKYMVLRRKKKNALDPGLKLIRFNDLTLQ